MNLVTVNIESIRIGQPLPFSLRDEEGVLLAPKGYVLTGQSDLDLMLDKRVTLYIELTESENYHRAYVARLHNLINEERPLGQIADTHMSLADLDKVPDLVDISSVNTNHDEPDWLDLQTQTHAMLRNSNPVSFLPRLNRLQAQLSRHTRANPDGTLLALMHLSSNELRMYSATHAMLVMVMCSLAAREVFKWSEALEVTLCNAALTMNIGMTELQDQLSQQKEAPTQEQRRRIRHHALRSANLLEQLGVTDPCWLEAVLAHHTKTPGPLASRQTSQRIARLIQRADMFAACLAPRASRVAVTAAHAMKASYFDENRLIDEAGAGLIKAVGIYSPGSFVRLATQEIAMVIKRGANTTTPHVAVVINRAGMPTGEPMVRDTSQAEFKIVTGLAHRDVKVKINLNRLLQLTKQPSSNRFWQKI